MWFLAVRDNEQQKAIKLEPIEPKAANAEFASARTQYPPPRFDVMLATAANVETFQRNFPRFADAPTSGPTKKPTPGGTP